jgi:hypothetical protein
MPWKEGIFSLVYSEYVRARIRRARGLAQNDGGGIIGVEEAVVAVTVVG